MDTSSGVMAEGVSNQDLVSVDTLAKSFNGKLMLRLKDEWWEEAEEEEKNVIAMKLMNGKNFHRADLIQALRNAWKCKHGIQFKDLPGNMVAAKFEDEDDMVKVLEGGPWNYLGTVVLMKKWIPEMSPQELEIKHVNLWLQIHNLPLGLMKEEIIKELASHAGSVVGYNKQEGLLERARYARVRIAVDVSKPLRQGLYIERRRLEPLWLEFRYERVPTMCKICFVIGHDESKCGRGEDRPIVSNEIYGKDSRNNVADGENDIGDTQSENQAEIQQSGIGGEQRRKVRTGVIGVAPVSASECEMSGTRKVINGESENTNNGRSPMLNDSHANSPQSMQSFQNNFPSIMQKADALITKSNDGETKGVIQKGKEKLIWEVGGSNNEKIWASGPNERIRQPQLMIHGDRREGQGAGKEHGITAIPKGMKRKKRSGVAADKLLQLVDEGCLFEVNVKTVQSKQKVGAEGKEGVTEDDVMEEAETGSRSRPQQ